MPAIHSVEEFLQTFGVGDAFYYTHGCYGRHDTVTGPCIIVRIYKDEVKVGEWMNRLELIGPQYISDMFVSDLVNESHGCFTNRAEAEVYMIARQTAFDTNPIAVLDMATQIEIDRLFDDAIDYDRYDDEEDC